MNDPLAPSAPNKSPTPPDKGEALLGLLVGVAIIAAAGLGAGEAIRRFASLGAILLWPAGWFAGLMTRRVAKRPDIAIRGVLIGCCFLAIAFAETYWIRYATENGKEGWVVSIQFLPVFVQEFPTDALVALVFTILGAIACWRETATRIMYSQ